MDPKEWRLSVGWVGDAMRGLDLDSKYVRLS